MLEIILYSFLIMSASLVGVISIWTSLGRFIENNLRYLVSFSAGVFLIISYQLSVEALEHSSSLVDGLMWIILGVVGIFILFRFLPSFHHHHDDHEEKGHHHSHLDARRILVSDALHNLGDGILLSASFAVSPILGVMTAVSVFVHELVQEVSEFFVLRQAGFSTSKALNINFLVSGTILFGSVGGFLLLDTLEIVEVPVLGLSAGAFLVVVLHDLIPHSVRNSNTKKHYALHFLAFILGIFLMGGIYLSTVHSHELEEENEQITFLLS